MQQSARLATLAAVLTIAALRANAQDADVAAGHDLARRVCVACHVVDGERPSRPLIAGAPAFRDVANTSGMTATALHVFLTTWHPKMPNLILKPEEMRDVIAYILSLRG
jgi:mono/diheme cytochrome c family protein